MAFKKNLKVTKLFTIFLAIVTLSVFVVYAAHIVTVNPVTFNPSEDVSAVLNVSVNNSYAEPSAANITIVNITIPSGFSFAADTNGTSVSALNFTFSISGQVATWINTTNSGLVAGNETRFFWINVTATTPGSTYNITVNTKNATATTITNISAIVNDTTTPTTVTIYSPLSYGNYSIGNPLVLLNVSIVDNGLVGAVFFNITNSSGWQNQTYASNASTGWWNATINITSISGFPEGVYNITVWANDTYNNLNNTGRVTFRIDRTVPSVSSGNISSPVNDGNYSGGLFFNVSIYDFYGVGAVFFNVTNSSGTQNGTWKASNPLGIAWNASIVTSAYPDGVYNITIWANDSAGNAYNNSAKVIRVRFDNTAPTVGTITATATTTSLSLSVPVNDSGSDLNSVNDTGSDINSCTIDKGTAATLSSDKRTLTFSENSLTCATTYYYMVNCTDLAGNSAVSSNQSFATSSCATSGGSGGNSANTPAAARKASQTWTKITPGNVTIMKITDQAIGLKQISITVNNPAQSVQITVTKYDGKPANVSVAKSGKVYGYLQIEAKNLAASLGKAVITSQVNKTWISSNGLTKDKIALWKFDDTAKVWKEIPTTWKESDATREYFESEVTSFSYFAIGEKTAAVVTTGDGTTGATNDDTIGAGTTDNAAKPKIKTWAFILLIIAIVVIIAVVVIWITTSKGSSTASRGLASKVKVKHP